MPSVSDTSRPWRSSASCGTGGRLRSVVIVVGAGDDAGHPRHHPDHAADRATQHAADRAGGLAAFARALLHALHQPLCVRELRRIESEDGGHRQRGT